MTDEEEIKELLGSIRSAYGYDFTEYAMASVKRRIHHFMNIAKFTSIRALGSTLLREESLFEQFIQEITVNVTEMFRDPSFYKSLRGHVIQRLATYPFIKIWIAGASTGEEVYSTAIFLKEEGLLERSVIYATDINQRALPCWTSRLSKISYSRCIIWRLTGRSMSFNSFPAGTC